MTDKDMALAASSTGPAPFGLSRDASQAEPLVPSAFSPGKIMAAIARHARERADWLHGLDERDPVRVMCDLALSASCYASQPYEAQRRALERDIKAAKEIETALLTAHLASGIEALKDQK